MTRVVVASSLEDIKDKAEKLRSIIDADSRASSCSVVDPEERAAAYTSHFRDHSLFPQYNAYLNSAHEVASPNTLTPTLAAAKKPPFHTKAWHKKALKKWERVLKSTTACKDWVESQSSNYSREKAVRTAGSIPMHNALIRHAKEEIDFHKQMIDLFEKEANK